MIKKIVQAHLLLCILQHDKNMPFLNNRNSCIWLGGEKGHDGAIELSVSPGLKLEAGVKYTQCALRKIKDHCFEFVASGDRYPFQLILSTRRADGARQGKKARILAPGDVTCFKILASASGVDERGNHYEVRIVEVPLNSLAAFCVESGEHTDYICAAYDRIVAVNNPSESVLRVAGYSFRFVGLMQGNFKEI